MTDIYHVGTGAMKGTASWLWSPKNRRRFVRAQTKQYAAMAMPTPTLIRVAKRKAPCMHRPLLKPWLSLLRASEL